MIPPGTKTKNFVLTPHDLGRMEACPASTLFVPLEKEKPSFAMWWGIGVHKYLEFAKTTGKPQALAYMRRKFPRMVSYCEKLPVEDIPDGETELQLLIHTESRSAFVGDYSDAMHDEHFYARADLIYCESTTGSLLHWVADYKSGDAKDVYPATSPQIKTLCAAKWLLEGKPNFIGGQIIPLKTFEDRRYIFTGLEMEAHLAYVRRVHLIVQETRSEFREEGVAPEFVPGAHCRGCDIHSQCPVQQAAVVIEHVKVAP